MTIDDRFGQDTSNSGVVPAKPKADELVNKLALEYQTRLNSSGFSIQIGERHVGINDEFSLQEARRFWYGNRLEKLIFRGKVYVKRSPLTCQDAVSGYEIIRLKLRPATNVHYSVEQVAELFQIDIGTGNRLISEKVLKRGKRGGKISGASLLALFNKVYPMEESEGYNHAMQLLRDAGVKGPRIYPSMPNSDQVYAQKVK